MTSLEFIEKEIRELKFQINYIKSNMKKYIDFRTEGQLEIDIKQLKLNHLEQIKSKLEAWEVVRKHLEHFPSDFYNGIPEEVITMTSEIDKKDYTVIKKALEVEDE